MTTTWTALTPAKQAEAFAKAGKNVSLSLKMSPPGCDLHDPKTLEPFLKAVFEEYCPGAFFKGHAKEGIKSAFIVWILDARHTGPVPTALRKQYEETKPEEVPAPKTKKGSKATTAFVVPKNMDAFVNGSLVTKNVEAMVALASENGWEVTLKPKASGSKRKAEEAEEAEEGEEEEGEEEVEAPPPVKPPAKKRNTKNSKAESYGGGEDGDFTPFDASAINSQDLGQFLEEQAEADAEAESAQRQAQEALARARGQHQKVALAKKALKNPARKAQQKAQKALDTKRTTFLKNLSKEEAGVLNTVGMIDDFGHLLQPVLKSLLTQHKGTLGIPFLGKLNDLGLLLVGSVIQ